jgi:hypothetical protein
LGLGIFFEVIYLLKFVSPPTQRRFWLQKHYPDVSRAVQRYKQPGDIIETYFPVLVVNNQKYFLLAYHDRKPPRNVKRFTLVDDTGGVLDNLDLIKKVARTKTLALFSIAPAYHQKRITAFESSKSALQGLARFFDLMHRQRNHFAPLGTTSFSDYERILEVEAAVKDVSHATLAMIDLEAKWVADHGFGRLTEVSYEDVLKLESQIREIRKPVVAAIPPLESVVEPALRLVNVLRGRTWPVKHKMIQGLMGLTDLARGLMGADEYYLSRMSTGDLKAWREGLAWAAEVDSQSNKEA